MAMKLSDRVVAGVRPVRARYALASEAGFDDGQSPIAAFEFDGALPHLLVDQESMNVGGWSRVSNEKLAHFGNRGLT